MRGHDVLLPTALALVALLATPLRASACSCTQVLYPLYFVLGAPLVIELHVTSAEPPTDPRSVGSGFGVQILHTRIVRILKDRSRSYEVGDEILLTYHHCNSVFSGRPRDPDSTAIWFLGAAEDGRFDVGYCSYALDGSERHRVERAIALEERASRDLRIRGRCPPGAGRSRMPANCFRRFLFSPIYGPGPYSREWRRDERRRRAHGR